MSEYARLNYIELPRELLLFDRIHSSFQPIPEASKSELLRNVSENVDGADSPVDHIPDSVKSLRMAMRLLFVSSLIINPVESKGLNIYRAPWVEESPHPISAIADTYSVQRQWPGASLLQLCIDQMALGVSSKNAILFNFTDHEGVGREKRITDKSTNEKDTKDGILLHCGEAPIKLSLSLDARDKSGWGYKISLLPRYFDEGISELATYRGLVVTEKSDRPYVSNFSPEPKTIVVPGAEAILIVFDETSFTMSEQDYIQFYVDSEASKPLPGGGPFR